LLLIVKVKMPRVAAVIEENPLARMHPGIRYLSPIKTATVADLRNNFATLSPMRKRGKVAEPLDRMARLRKLFPNGPVADSQAVLDYDRGNS